jgi:YbgC/YbaW family acyl-CoA thioester hydrolase
MSDLDPFNHVNNGAQCHLFDYGRTAYFETLLGENINWSKMNLVLVHVSMDFHAPLLASDKVICESQIVAVGNKSLTMKQLLIDENTHTLKTTCNSVLCCIDRNTMKAVELPASYRQKLNIS